MGDQRNQSARTYVVLRGGMQLIGYYSLAAASAEYEIVPARIAKGLAQHPIPLCQFKHHLAGSSSYKQVFYMAHSMVSSTNLAKYSLRINIVTSLLIIEWE